MVLLDLGAGNKTDAEIKKIANDWIAANQSEFDGWVKNAAAAGK
ncbi:hypothetical protein [Mesorhizobium sp. CA13]|nr:hypothetical protein [Mesorhizobium sp. CA13]